MNRSKKREAGPRHVTPADVGDRATVSRLCVDIQDATGEEVELAYVDQGYTGDAAAKAA